MPCPAFEPRGGTTLVRTGAELAPALCGGARVSAHTPGSFRGRQGVFASRCPPLKLATILIFWRPLGDLLQKGLLPRES
jgi:hypothetical protein